MIMTKKFKEIEFPHHPNFVELGGSVEKYEELENALYPGWTMFNPSIAYSPKEGYAMTVRSSNYWIEPKTGIGHIISGGDVVNKNFFCKLDDDLKIIEYKMIETRELQYRGMEDIRLTWSEDDGCWRMTVVYFEPALGYPTARIADYIYAGDKATRQEVYDYDFSKPAQIEKNWMPPTSPNPNFDFVYNSQQIVKDGEKITLRDAPASSVLRGGTPLWDLGDETYLAVVHDTYHQEVLVTNQNVFGTQRNLVRNYVHRFARYDYTGKMIQLSDEFQFHKPGIEFACGIIIKDDTVVVSFGFRDWSSWLGKISLAKVMEMLKDV